MTIISVLSRIFSFLRMIIDKSLYFSIDNGTPTLKYEQLSMSIMVLKKIDGRNVISAAS